jgi:hypothetical protein
LLLLLFFSNRFVFALLNQMIRHKVCREVNISAVSQGGKHDDLVDFLGR